METSSSALAANGSSSSVVTTAPNGPETISEIVKSEEVVPRLPPTYGSTAISVPVMTEPIPNTTTTTVSSIAATQCKPEEAGTIVHFSSSASSSASTVLSGTPAISTLPPTTTTAASNAGALTTMTSPMAGSSTSTGLTTASTSASGSPETSGSSTAERGVFYGVFVTHINRVAEESHLYQAFNGCGQVVSARIIRDPITNYSKGYGFVNFKTIEERDSAVEKMQDLKILGEAVVVRKGNDTHLSRSRSSMGGSSTPFSGAGSRHFLFDRHRPHHHAAGRGGHHAAAGGSVEFGGQMPYVDPNNVVYFGNIPDKMDDLSLQSYIEQVLGYRCASFKRKEHYAFVGFASAAQASNCIRALNGMQLGSLSISVQPAKKPTDSSVVHKFERYIVSALGRSPLDSQQIYMLEKSYRTLYIGQLPPTADRDDLASCFAKYGTVVDSRIVKDMQTQVPRYGFVIFQSMASVTAAISATEMGVSHAVHGRELSVQHSRAPKAVVAIASRNGLTDMNGRPSAILQSIINSVTQEQMTGAMMAAMPMPMYGYAPQQWGAAATMAVPQSSYPQPYGAGVPARSALPSAYGSHRRAPPGAYSSYSVGHYAPY